MYLLLQAANVESLPSVCRLCATTTLNVSCLDTFAESNRHIISAIQKHLEIEICDKDNLPKSVCQSCTQKVEEWDEFYSDCRKVQGSLMDEPPTPVETSEKSSGDQQTGESSNLNTSHHLLEKLELEELAQEGSAQDMTGPETEVVTECMLLEAKQQETSPVEEDVQTDDEFLDALSTEEEDDEELSDESNNSQPSNKTKQQNKKFIFTIPFLERKVGRSFTKSEKKKLQKLISKRSNTMIYEMLVGGGPDQDWECQVCQMTITGRVSEVSRHYHESHQMQAIFPCHACDYTSRSEKMYHAHRMTHLVEYPCPHCTRVFTLHSRLVYHLNSHINEREFACDLCDKKFNQAQYLISHKRKVHGDQESLLKFTCEQCGMRFKYKNHLQYHLKRHPTDENPLPYNCKYCDDHFASRAEQLAHSNTIHAGEGDFVCHLCGKKMKTMVSLENHVKLHSGEKEFKCEECGAAFATNHSLKCHRKIHERKSTTYDCPVCQKKMSNKSSLNQHIKTHTGTKPHQCQYCDSAFIHKNRLEIHMRKHTGEFPHTCVDCGKGFRSTSSMNSHRQYVHSERTFPCPVCNKAFKTTRDLKVHSTLHTGEKPNVCQICGKAFRVRANYFKHRKIHLKAASVLNAQTTTGGEEEEEEEEEEQQQQQQQQQQQESNLNVPQPVTAAAAGSSSGDFFQFANDQQWIN